MEPRDAIRHRSIAHVLISQFLNIISVQEDVQRPTAQRGSGGTDAVHTMPGPVLTHTHTHWAYFVDSLNHRQVCYARST